MSGLQDIVIAGGVESMTRVPMGSPITLAKAGGIGANPFSEAIQKRYGVEMFSKFHGAQMIADNYGFTRDDHDRFAFAHYRQEAGAMNPGAVDAHKTGRASGRERG